MADTQTARLLPLCGRRLIAAQREGRFDRRLVAAQCEGRPCCARGSLGSKPLSIDWNVLQHGHQGEAQQHADRSDAILTAVIVKRRDTVAIVVLVVSAIAPNTALSSASCAVVASICISSHQAGRKFKQGALWCCLQCKDAHTCQTGNLKIDDYMYAQLGLELK